MPSPVLKPSGGNTRHATDELKNVILKRGQTFTIPRRLISDCWLVDLKKGITRITGIITCLLECNAVPVFPGTGVVLSVHQYDLQHRSFLRTSTTHPTLLSPALYHQPLKQYVAIITFPPQLSADEQVVRCLTGVTCREFNGKPNPYISQLYIIEYIVFCLNDILVHTFRGGGAV
jgi:hypothetical protein